MSRRWLAFDLEIAALDLDDGGDWKARRPLGITCAAFAELGNDGAIKTETFCGADTETGFAPRMSRQDCRGIVYELRECVEDGGFTLLTWNGLSFDLDILAEESGMHAECVELAMNHVDMMLHFFCEKGYPVGLDAVARGMGLQGKTEGMDGALAPQLWHDGEYDKVLEYVQQDVRTTLEVALAVEKRQELRWITQKGRLNGIPISRWLTVRESLALPLPDTSWMTSPLPRSKFVEWMQANQPT